MKRVSYSIRRQQATTSRPAILLAEKLETPLNYVATLNFSHTAVNPSEVSKAFSKVRARANRWAINPSKKSQAKPFKMAFMWVIENTQHIAAHWLLHIPQSRIDDFEKRLPEWLNKEVGDFNSPTTIDIREAYNPHGLRKYMLKGIDPNYAPLYRIQHIPQGKVEGKRFGFSTNIGPNQCRIHGTKKKWFRPTNASSYEFILPMN